MGKLKYLIIHCSATPAYMEVTKEDIARWHLIGRKWSRLGYRDMIHQDGCLTNLTPFDSDGIIDNSEMTWGAKGFNSNSIHLMLVGGMKDGKPFDTRTPKQKDASEIYVREAILRHPVIQVLGHNQVSNKACPSFDVPAWLRWIGVNEKNIYADNNN